MRTWKKAKGFLRGRSMKAEERPLAKADNKERQNSTEDSKERVGMRSVAEWKRWINGS